MDKRFWSGAIVVVTVVVGGASALPALLLRPDVVEEPLIPVPVAKAPDPAPVARLEPAPVAAKAVEAPQIAAPAPQPAAAEAASAPRVAAPAPPQPAAAAEAAPAPPQPAAAAEAAPAPPAVQFPPVQPVGVAMQPGPDAAPQPSQSRAASAKPEGTRTTTPRAPRMTLQDAKKRKRSVRPAIFPLREFFAWRR